MKKEIQNLIKKEAEAILNLPLEKSFEDAVDLIVERVHKSDGKIVASGMGKAGQIAINIATTLSSTGTPAVFLHPSDAQHGDLGVIQKNDILLVISNSGKTREILELVDLVNNLHKNIPLIVITGNHQGSLARLAQICISTGAPREICPLGLTPTTSTTAMTVIGDIMVVMLMKKINFTAADYAKRHHGGYLGDKSRNAAK